MSSRIRGWDGTVHCRMLEIEPHRKLSYTWVAGDMELERGGRRTETVTRR